MFLNLFMNFFLLSTVALAEENKDIEKIITDVWADISKHNKIEKVLNFTITDQISPEYYYSDVDVLMGDGSYGKKHIIVDGYGAQEPDINVRGETELFRNQVIRKLKKLKNEVDDKSESFWVEILGIKNNILVQEDPQKTGYKKLNISQKLDLDHSKIVLATLAKLHAMTAVLAERREITENDFLHGLMSDEGLMNFTKLNRLSDRFILSVQLAWGPEWSDAATRLKAKFDTMPEILKHMKYNGSDSFPLTVINIADVLMHSLYFKYSISDVYTSDKPIAFKIDNDYLSPIYGYPLFDLQIFLATTVNTTVQLHYNDHLVKHYHSALIQQLKKYKYKAEVPSIQMLFSEVRKTDVFKLYVCMAVSRFMILADMEERDFEFPEKYVEEAKNLGRELNRPEQFFFTEKFIEYMKQIVKKAMDDNII